MATSLMFRRTPNQLDTLVIIDVVVTEQHASDSDVTDHPVEVGIDITDHFRPKPRVLKLDCVLTDTPIGPGQLAVPGRSRDAYEEIARLQTSGTLITVTTQLRQYENLLITSLGAPIDVATGDGLKFSMTMKEIRTVESKTVPVRVSVPRAAKKAKLGKKSAAQADDATANKSALKRLIDFGVKKFGG